MTALGRDVRLMPMRHADFRIGASFWSGGREWRCTDIGTRVITAVRLADTDDPTLSEGPPYAFSEVVFDEHAIESCTLSSESDSTEPLAPAHGASLPELEWDDPKASERRRAQAASLRAQAREGGLRFEAYLPSRLADWLLAHVERGTFHDPSEAVFVILGEHQELEPHTDLRQELLARSLQAAMDDPRPGIPADEFLESLKQQLREPLPPAAAWRRMP